MKVSILGHERNHGARTLREGGPKRIGWNEEEQCMTMKFVCAPNSVSEGSQHDMLIEMSVRDVAELVGHLARCVGNTDALRPLASVVALILCGGPPKRQQIADFWEWFESEG